MVFRTYKLIIIHNYEKCYVHNIFITLSQQIIDSSCYCF